MTEKLSSALEHRGQHRPNSIRTRIVSITVSCLLIMCVIISGMSYYIFGNYLRESLVRSSESGLKLIADSIDSSFTSINNLVRYCRTGTAVTDYIAHNPNPGDVLAVASYDRISEEYANNPANSYIPRLAIITDSHFLQIVNATFSSTMDLSKEVPALPFYHTLLDSREYNFSTGFIRDPFYRNGIAVLPVIRPIEYQFSSAQGGVVFMEISSALFSDAFGRYSIPEDSALYLNIVGHTYRYKNGSFIEIASDSEAASPGLVEGFSVFEEDMPAPDSLVSVPLSLKGCSISQSISTAAMQAEQRMLRIVLMCTVLCIVMIGVVLMLMLNRMISVPVARIRDKMVRISGGDFSRDPDIEWEHELGDIGRGINDLSEDVLTLMNKRLEDEKLKNDLEYKVLQSQINPHFIYNTLNSIKWMATVQGSEGISEMTTALAKLLKSISKGTSLTVPIREELSLLGDYFTIQSYRYGGTITMRVEVDDERIYDCGVIKFTLQPLVENAIFHGIEPKGSGEIIIHAYYEEEGRIRIDVSDNGVGIPHEKLESLLDSDTAATSDFFREFGVRSVHRRLIYEYGAGAGITFTSEEGVGTTMSVHIPAGPVSQSV